LGDVHQLSVESQNYILPKLTIENLDDFKEKASLKEINFKVYLTLKFKNSGLYKNENL
jgi:hypothetical protein